MIENEPEWKYATYLASLSGCPPADAQLRERDAFRFVWDPIDQRGFDPVALRSPRRANRPNQPSCSAYGLSMFTTEWQARDRFGELEEKHPEIRKTIGTHLACVALTVAHGVQTPEKSSGHFDLHEYKDVDLVPVSSIVSPL